MNINATFFAQLAVFFLLVLFTMKFVWPPIAKALDERASKIADGLAAAEQGRRSLETSNIQADEAIQQARSRAAEILSQAEKRSAQMIDEARQAAREEGAREKTAAKAEIDQEVTRAREQLREQVAALAVSGAEKILRREVDSKAHAELLEGIKRQL